MRLILVILLSMILGIYTVACSRAEIPDPLNDAEMPTQLSDTDISIIGQRILEVAFDNDNWYYSRDPRTAYNAHMYHLHSIGVFTDDFFSSDYWLDMGHWRVWDPTVSLDGPVIYYVSILPKHTNEYFYLITNRFTPYDPRDEYSQPYELRKYYLRDVHDAAEVYEALLRGDDFGHMECEIIGI